MADVAAEPVTSSASGAGAPAGTASGVTSGTASEAMIKAAMASEGATSTTDKTPAPGTAGAVVAAGTTAQPGTDGKPTSTQEPPKERWESILANQRTAAAAEALKPFAWAKDLKADEVQAAMTLVNTLRTNPAAFWRELGEMVNAKSGTTTTETKEEALPDPDYTSNDGGKFYSADALKKTLDIFGKQLMQRFQGELRPLVDFRDGELQTRQKATAVNNAKQLAGQALTQARALPHFKEHEAAIVETLQKMDSAVRTAVGPIAAMYMAFEQVKIEKVYPTIDAEAEKRVRANYDKKAAAGGVNPVGGDGKVAEKPVIKGQTGLSAYMEKLEGSNDPRFVSA